MVSTELLAQIDERLRTLYDPNKIFGGMSLMLVGDFHQLDVVGGVSLCKNMYVDPKRDHDVKARDLFRRFRVFFLHEQLRAQKCKRQQKNLEDFHRLPDRYPNGTAWNDENGAGYFPVTPQILSSLQQELTPADIINDPGWLYDYRILVTGNLDRATLTQPAVLTFAALNNTLVIRWRRQIKESIPEAVASVLYDEDTHPYLFAYFTQNAPAQILDNGVGNVILGVANGTACYLHSLGWDDSEKAQAASDIILGATQKRLPIVNLPWPPEYINVVLINPSGEEVNGLHWPGHLNLETAMVSNSAGETYKSRVIIPIGIITAKADNDKVKFSHISRSISMKPPRYIQHAVDLAFASTVWKAQGATILRILMLLQETHPAPPWQFAHLFVGTSRVETVQGLRCIPLTPSFTRHEFLQLRPDIFTVKWLMSIGSDGYWHQLDQTQ